MIFIFESFVYLHICSDCFIGVFETFINACEVSVGQLCRTSRLIETTIYFRFDLVKVFVFFDVLLHLVKVLLVAIAVRILCDLLKAGEYGICDVFANLKLLTCLKENVLYSHAVDLVHDDYDLLGHPTGI